MKLKNSVLILMTTALLFSCDKKRAFDEYQSVGGSWNKDSVVTFSLPLLDSTKRYDLYVNLRGNNNYKYNNIFLIVSLESRNGYTKTDTLEYLMTSPDGTLLGDGFTDIKESKLYYKENVRFRGNYKVHIQQVVRETGKIPGVPLLEGITEVGFRIEKKE